MRSNHLRSNRPANSMEQDSFDSFDDIEDMLVMNTANMSLNGSNTGSPGDHRTVSPHQPAGDELPRSLIVTNVDLKVFDNEDIKVRERNIINQVLRLELSSIASCLIKIDVRSIIYPPIMKLGISVSRFCFC